MALTFDNLRVIEIKNTSKECVEVVFSVNQKYGWLQKTNLVLFETQIKYVITEVYDTHKKVKVYIRDDNDPIVIVFYPEEYMLYETFFLALYNKIA